MDAIVTQGLSKVYKGIGKQAVHSLTALDLMVREKEIFGFLGRNGAGKTTTIKILCSLLQPASGEAFLFGENIRARATRRLAGYLPEQPYFYEYLTPKETLDFYGKLRGLNAAERAGEWEQLSGMLDLRAIGNDRIKGFSKGMRQRVGFAVALVGNPPLLILDEPMSGLDPIGRRMIRELIVQQRDLGKTIFFSSHVLSDVEQICDRVGILVKGRLTQQGRIDELLAGQTPQVEVTAERVLPGTAALLRAKADQHRRLEERDIFLFPDAESANGAVKAIQEGGGRLLEFSPVQETLEDYFLREQAHGEHAA